MKLEKGWVIRSILKYGSPILSVMEKAGTKKHGGIPARKSCVFIIGAPRTGSTILYQLITSLLNVSYIDNLANMARNNPYVGLRLSTRAFGEQSHQSFSSRFGNTMVDGLHAPAEALFFYKWFPRDRHFTVPSDLRPEQIKEFVRTINALINRYDKALVIKNLSFSLRLQLLRDALPGAKFIVVRRDPLYAAQSLLLAMRKNKAPANKVWGILPKESDQLEGLETAALVVRQIYLIEKQIHQDLKKIPDAQILYIDYEKLSDNFGEIMEDISSLLGPDISKRPGTSIPEISISNRINLDETEINSLKKHIGELDWEYYNT